LQSQTPTILTVLYNLPRYSPNPKDLDHVLFWN